MQIDREKMLKHLNTEIDIIEQQASVCMTKYAREWFKGGLVRMQELKQKVESGTFDIESEDGEKCIRCSQEVDVKDSLCDTCYDEWAHETQESMAEMFDAEGNNLNDAGW